MKDGYYWVKYNGSWRRAMKQGHFFYFAGSETQFIKEDFSKIGDYIETPDKYKDN